MIPPDEAQPFVREKKRKRHLAVALASVFSLFLLGAVLFTKRSLEPTASVFADPTLPTAILNSSSSLWRPDPPQESLLGLSQPKAVAGFGNSSLSLSGITGGVHTYAQLSPSPSPAAAPPPLQLLILRNVLPLQPAPDISVVPNVSVLDNALSPARLPKTSELTDKGGGSSSVGKPELAKEDRSNLDNCDFYSGTWVRDEEDRYPLYQPRLCPYVDKAFACQENGRRDAQYMKWRWKPDGCQLPRFNATDFLERLRGRSLMLVGDSMSRNQFESMLCLLHEALPDKNKMFETSGYKLTKGRGNFVFIFVDYNCTVEFIRSQFLVRRGTLASPVGRGKSVLKIDEVDKSSSRWKHADILVFNTGHWWTHKKTFRGKDYFQEGDTVYPKLDPLVAYKKALRTWGKWIESNINPRRKMVFFLGYGNAHYRGGDWDSGGTCNGETEPAFRGAILNNYPWQMTADEEVIREMRFPVVLLNVTRLTNFRKDAHPSVYGNVYFDDAQQSRGTRGLVSTKKQDCSHWCLPGVPDAWNELVYAHLVLSKK